MIQKLIAQLEEKPLERLRFRVLREFKTLPSAPAAKAMSDWDVILCGIHLLLDAKEAVQTSSKEEGVYTMDLPEVDMFENPSFDIETFCQRQRGEL